MQVIFTPATERAIAEAARWSTGHNLVELQTVPMLLGLLAESECRAAVILRKHNITKETLTQHWPELRSKEGNSADGIKYSADLRLSLEIVTQWLVENGQTPELATEHVLLALAAADHELGRWLRDQGVAPQSIREEIAQLYGWPDKTFSSKPIDLPDGIEPLSVEDSIDGHLLAELLNRTPEELAELSVRQPSNEEIFDEELSPGSALRALRVIDAAANRAREGLRVAEDYVRFVLDDTHLTEQLKQLRHDLVAALSPISPYLRLVARETQHDVGTQLTTRSEQARGRLEDVLTANLVRLQESLRSLEEFGKLVDPGMAAAVKQLRYKAYTLQRAITITTTARHRLASAKLYVLIDGRSSPREFESMVRALIESGVDIIQLRDKILDDRQLLARARQLAALTSACNTLFIMNDRPDLAALAGADGVHVGQGELSVKDARSIVGPHALVGVSTHSLEQARGAVLDGADYIGVGPTFPSGTKQFDDFPGIELLEAVSARIRLPAFAIGGIDASNVERVIAAGFTRIAVSGAITSAGDVTLAVEELLAKLS
ncbi:MAG: thiamine phosphate synthase [Pirellulales bacterium]|nr:thiamine phosphate synthase [Pirellulales bacterium]